jgi:hypothetical protein
MSVQIRIKKIHQISPLCIPSKWCSVAVPYDNCIPVVKIWWQLTQISAKTHLSGSRITNTIQILMTSAKRYCICIIPYSNMNSWDMGNDNRLCRCSRHVRFIPNPSGLDYWRGPKGKSPFWRTCPKRSILMETVGNPRQNQLSIPGFSVWSLLSIPVKFTAPIYLDEPKLVILRSEQLCVVLHQPPPWDISV